MAEIDFITAFARLLCDGKLREEFATNPQAVAEKVQLHPADLPAWLQLIPADVEFQADVLLHKRLDLVKFFAPETCRRLGEKLWPEFRGFARLNWPAEGGEKFLDAFQFCRHLRQQNSRAVAASEWNRLDFALSKRWAACHWVPMPVKKMKMRRGFQLFIRSRGGRWREIFLYFWM